MTLRPVGFRHLAVCNTVAEVVASTDHRQIGHEATHLHHPSAPFDAAQIYQDQILAGFQRDEWCCKRGLNFRHFSDESF
jgi:hypothetical protein